MLTTELRFGVHHGQSCPNTENTMNDKYFDMVKTMAQQLDTSDLMELVVNLVSHLNSVHHFDDDGTIRELLTEICNKHGMYTTLCDEPNLTDWCASQLTAHDKLVFADQAEVIEYLENQDFYVFGTEKQMADYVVEDMEYKGDLEGYTFFKHTTHQGHRTYGELDEMARVLQESRFLVISPDKLKELGGSDFLLDHINETIDLDVVHVHRWSFRLLAELYRTCRNDDYGNPKPWSERIK